MARRLLKPLMFALCAVILMTSFTSSPKATEAASLQEAVLLDYPVARSFNGSSDYVDKTADVSSVSSLHEGSIAVRFKTTSSANALTLISASHTSDPSSNLSLTLNGGNVYFENRENGVYATQITASGKYNDGAWHTAVLTVNSRGTNIYIDGSLRGNSTGSAFFSQVTSLNGMWIGRNVDNGGGQWYFNGEMDYVKVYNRSLAATEVMELSGVSTPSIVTYPVNQTFNGTSDARDQTADIGRVSNLTQGSIAVKFKTSSSSAAGAFLSASDTTNPSSNLSFTINNGTVYFENRNNGNYATKLSASGKFNDGKWHTAILTVGTGSTKIYIDGEEKASSSSQAFFSSVSNLNGMWVGKNVDNGGSQWYFSGSIDHVTIYDHVLSSSQIKQLSGVMEEKILFDVADGKGYGQYRIPSIVVTANNTVLVAAEARTGGDQTPTDIVLKRSTDGGDTFSEQIMIAPGKSQGVAEMNPMLLAEKNSSVVHILWSRWKWGACQYFIRTSTDGGLTWGETKEITSVLDDYKNPNHPNYFANLAGAGMGPGHGIELTDGTLVVPIYLTTSGWTNSTVGTIYSTDGGVTWKAGSLVPNPSGFQKIHENMMVQLSSGKLMANMRNPGSPYRAISTTDNVTSAWSTPVSDTALIDPVVQASTQRYDANHILFTNPANTTSRTNFTIRISNDDAATWYKSKEIYPLENGYSDIAVGPDQSILVFYEKPASSKISLVRLNKSWIEAP
ncbi:LamG-like jellyroll fold domain-containing protein [Paenibacillus sp. Marseille-Q4541]|uniref:LamG-like jellyroll fold domain-containing protein n=1 Tax=Paenibacillus sp. Marseille-Q4541 TaxID=2831522 RepID=UPI001BA746DF|nr:LamG-like jellyroll fold domain-containing protein [Paenibacillus sp. Marseille-Q4541]